MTLYFSMSDFFFYKTSYEKVNNENIYFGINNIKKIIHK